MVTNLNQFEETVGNLTQPLNGQYPRPWMTKLIDPQNADVFIVGKNQRNGYDCSKLGTHQRHMDALFNRNGETCRQMYDRMTAGKASPTRKNTDSFVQVLESKGVTDILETNVICYSTPMSADLRLDQHTGGSTRGEEIFRYLMAKIKPKVLVVHGTGSRKKLASILRTDLGSEPHFVEDIRLHMVEDYMVAVIPSLAPPAYNKWSPWSQEHLSLLAIKIAAHLSQNPVSGTVKEI